MTVAELIRHLQALPQDAEVAVSEHTGDLINCYRPYILEEPTTEPGEWPAGTVVINGNY